MAPVFMWLSLLGQVQAPEVSLAGKLAEHGVLGVALAALGLYTWHLHKELRRVETERTHDAQAVTTQLIALNDKWNNAVTALTTALAAQHTLLEKLEDLVRETKDALKGSRR